MVILSSGCTPEEPNELDALGTTDLQVKTLSVRAWIADNDEERAKGLMFVTADELAPPSEGVERGMVFLFERDQRNGFWMRNTIVDLDIAYIREDGTIVETFTMKAFVEIPYVPSQPYRHALEVRSGVFAEHGIVAGDHIEIPESVLKRTR